MVWIVRFGSIGNTGNSGGALKTLLVIAVREECAGFASRMMMARLPGKHSLSLGIPSL